MSGYYSETLSAVRLKACYELAPPRVRQYLDAEIEHVLGKISTGDSLIEFGCGYGRVLDRLADRAKRVIGIDTSYASLAMGGAACAAHPNISLILMDAVRTGFRQGGFDAVICIQNGISAFHVDPVSLVLEGIRITRKGGLVLFSSYSDKFWEQRLAWFRIQSEAGLLGRIDEEKTRDGTIVCEDGFTATTVTPDQFRIILSSIDNVEANIVEVGESSVFCEIRVL